MCYPPELKSLMESRYEGDGRCPTVPDFPSSQVAASKWMVGGRPGGRWWWRGFPAKTTFPPKRSRRVAFPPIWSKFFPPRVRPFACPCLASSISSNNHERYRKSYNRRRQFNKRISIIYNVMHNSNNQPPVSSSSDDKLQI